MSNRPVPTIRIVNKFTGHGWITTFYSGNISYMAEILQGRDPREWGITDVQEVKQFFDCLGKHVIYFGGYGELGYESKEYVRGIIVDILERREPGRVVVHTGTLLRLGGHAGIADVYSIAHELGIETTGIYPSVAMNFGDTHQVSPDCDHPFFIEDKSWGGFIDSDRQASPTLKLHLAVSNELIMIGGGQHAADELEAFLCAKKKVKFFPAEMHHETSRQWSEAAGADIRDMRGAAHQLWLARTAMRRL